MKTYNITAQIFDKTSSSPNQSILYNEVVNSHDEIVAEKQFTIELASKNLTLQKILSIEELSSL